MNKGKILVVDDDRLVLATLTHGLSQAGYEVIDADNGDDAILLAREHKPDLALLDIRMEGKTGFDVFDVLNERGNRLPVIFLTGHGDVPMAVSAIKKGAFDFVEKPCNDNELANRVIAALQLDARQRMAASDADSVNTLIDRLSTRERQVMERILAGKLNKVIADELAISMRTVEVHRANLFDKMQVKTAVELANLLKTGH